MTQWRIIKGSEADFEGAPDWATHYAQVSSNLGILKAWEGADNRYCYHPDGAGTEPPMKEHRDRDGFIKFPWSGGPVEVIAQRERITSINDDRLLQSLNEFPLVSEKYHNTTQSLIAERGSRYGAFSDGSAIMQQLKQVMHDTPNWNNLSSSQKEALDMIQHKIGRILNGDPNYDDNWKDIAGYSTLVADELNGVKQ